MDRVTAGAYVCRDCGAVSTRSPDDPHACWTPDCLGIVAVLPDPTVEVARLRAQRDKAWKDLADLMPSDTAVLVNVADLASIDAEIDRYRAALEEIKRDCGRVCPGFQECTHASCTSSYAAWAIADNALGHTMGRRIA